jgi:N-acetylmuramic acid 6-phosphate etherase
MVNLHVKNSKLRERGIGILQQAAGVPRSRAQRALKKAGNRVPIALLMLQTGVPREQAELALASTKGHVRKAIALASQQRLNKK